MVMMTALLLAGCLGFAAWLRAEGRSTLPVFVSTSAPKSGYHAELKTEPAAVRAGEPASLSFMVKRVSGSTVRFLQFVHEKPMHLLVVSEDLKEFYHIHPEMQVDDAYAVRHAFPHGGAYRLYADYTPPGSGTIVEQYALNVEGPRRARVRLAADTSFVKASDGLRAEMSSDKPLRAGEDLKLTFSLADEKTGQPVNNLQLYLGSLAHFVVISEDLKEFIHAHPLDAGEVYDPGQDPALHVHDPAQLAKQLVGPSPSEVSAYVSFPRAGLYKLWAQFRRDEKVITVPFVLNVAAAAARREEPAASVPADAIRINVTSSGYEPAQINAKRGQPVKLAFYRADARGCAGTVVFPQLNVRRQLNAGETTVVEVTPAESGEITFTCGMGMYKGALVVSN
jgi:plastocyanin